MMLIWLLKISHRLKQRIRISLRRYGKTLKCQKMNHLTQELAFVRLCSPQVWSNGDWHFSASNLQFTLCYFGCPYFWAASWATLNNSRQTCFHSTKLELWLEQSCLGAHLTIYTQDALRLACYRSSFQAHYVSSSLSITRAWARQGSWSFSFSLDSSAAVCIIWFAFRPQQTWAESRWANVRLQQLRAWSTVLEHRVPA